MKVLLQRVTQASVSIGEKRVAQIGHGLVAFVGIAKGDTEEDAQYLVGKMVNLRLFSDKEGRLNLSALDINGEFLVVSQFTLLADTRKGRRPSFDQAALPSEAEGLFRRFVELTQATGLKVETGRFQQHMLVEIQNEGPVTILLNSKDKPLKN
jgi:D-aminoacyl-tRNA deacylase